ncbi:MAG TPA: 3-dehydroquinate synthase [bacterium]|nr:3-dehydroquinate synthase [bacterium]HPQ67252.1 3-dehydroquinate synthase [bacterium]
MNAFSSENETVVQGSRGESPVRVGPAMEWVGERLRGRAVWVVTDPEVDALYGGVWGETPRLTVGRGETAKTMATVENLCRELVAAGADRDAFLVGFGGGVVCDITGFAAAVYMRGIGFGFCPTTLLAQVDASVGGKNGVNLDGYKNLIGTFTQPAWVACDPAWLATLPETEWRCGLAEIVKHILVADGEKLEPFRQGLERLRRRDPGETAYWVKHSIRIKAGVVNRDEREAGERRILNFGHTFAHAIEKLYRYPHGEAVAAGMVLAARFSQALGLLPEEETERIRSLLAEAGLPDGSGVDPRSLAEAIRADKKRAGDGVRLVLLETPGRPTVRATSFAELESVLGGLDR